MKIKNILTTTTMLCALLFIACNKDDNTTTFKVKYSVTGNSVNQFKITQNDINKFIVTPFSGTKDTVVYIQSGTMVKLDTKADSNNLIGSIFVNDVLKVSGTDSDADKDGKTQVKIEYRLP